MLINRDSRPWILVSVIILLVATGLYVPYSHRLNGPSGGSRGGLLYGFAGSAMMLFALLLVARKRLPTLRVGRAYWWMQGHVWLGLLSYPIILFHAGFHWGGLMTQVLMWLFTIVIVSGIVGILLQQFMPRMMTDRVPLETIFEEIDHVVEQLREEADTLVNGVAERVAEPAYEVEVIPSAAETKVVAMPAAATPGFETLNTFYTGQVRPFLHDEAVRGNPLASERTAGLAFDRFRTLLPPELHETLEDLKTIVEERRQLDRQKRLHHWMHGWLWVHVPASYAMMILAAFHAVNAMRYVGWPF